LRNQVELEQAEAISARLQINLRRFRHMVFPCSGYRDGADQRC
jgi:hypothetical protein